MASNPPNNMVWYGWLDPLVVLIRLDILEVTLYWASVWLYSMGVGCTDIIVRRHPHVYPLE